MSALTEARNTEELYCDALKYEYQREVAAAAKIFAGSLAAQDADGKSVPASDTAGLKVLGRAEATVDAGETVPIRTGVFLFANGADTEALTVADIGKICYALDDQTVGKAGGTNKIVAGAVVDVTADGVAVEINPIKNHNHNAAYAPVPTPADAIGDLVLTSVTGAAGSEVYAAGDNSANLIADLLAIRNKLNALTAIAEENGFADEA